LLQGERDLSTPIAWARREAGAAPDAHLVVVANAGHSVQVRGLERGRPPGGLPVPTRAGVTGFGLNVARMGPLRSDKSTGLGYWCPFPTILLTIMSASSPTPIKSDDLRLRRKWVPTK
jgi:TAP-like protein